MHLVHARGPFLIPILVALHCSFGPHKNGIVPIMQYIDSPLD